MISGLPPSLLVESGTKNGRGLPWVVRITEKPPTLPEPWMRYPSLVGLAGTEESVLILRGGCQDCFARVAGIGARRTGQQSSTQDEPRMRLEGTSGN